MEKVDTDGIDDEPHPAGVNTVRRPVSRVLGTTDFTMVYYELAPDESFSGGLHRHGDQEEVFYVIEGTATFDVGRERERVDVEAGEAIRFAPGEFQYGYNGSEGRVTALAFGAPAPKHDWDQIEWVHRCRECGKEAIHDVAFEDGAIIATCRECGNELATG